MKIFTKKTTYNQNTGDPDGFRFVYSLDRCDFTGKELDSDYPEEGTAYPKFKLDYEDDDPMWGCGDGEREFGMKYSISMAEFLSDPYAFESEAEETMTIAGPFGLEFRAMRIETATRLLEAGEIHPEELHGYYTPNKT